VVDGKPDTDLPLGSPLDAAYDLLASRGPVVDGGSISLSAVARVLGMSRTNLYRRWPTSADLASDISVFRSTPEQGWHAEVSFDDGGSLADAIRRSLVRPGAADGVLARAAIATGSTPAARAHVAAWERGHLSSLAERLRREFLHDSSVPWIDVALGLMSMIEGMVIMAAQCGEGPGVPMEPELADEVAELAVRMVGFLTHEVEGVDGADLPVEGPEVGADGAHQPVDLPPRLVAALDDGALDVAPDGARRVVDMGVLARLRGVSERSLYKRWPTAADLNADLFLESVTRTRDAFARMLLEVFQDSATGPITDTMPLVARMNEWFSTPARFPEARVHLGLVSLLSASDVWDRVKDAVEVGLRHADMQTAGVVHATGYRLRPEVRMRTYTMMIVGMGQGTHRLAALHPQIVDRRLRYLGTDYVAAGVCHTAMTRTCTIPV
jgi:AcrR family transcriptional regulator